MAIGISTGGGEEQCCAEREENAKSRRQARGACWRRGEVLGGDWNIGNCEERLYIDEFEELGPSYSDII